MGRLEIPLNERGIQQAQRIAELLPSLEIEAIVTSPLKRALETSHIVAGKHKIPIKVDPNLTEVAFGRWEGLPFDELYRDKAYHRFLIAPLKTAVPGGETICDVQRRGLRALQRAARQFSTGRVLFVSHGDVLRAMLCHYLGLPLREFRRLRIDNGALSAAEVRGAWAEVKFVNYLPDIVPTSRLAYSGLNPELLRKKTKLRDRRSSSRR